MTNKESNLLEPIERIMDYIASRILPKSAKLPEHKPKILYIGCIDARLSPEKEIGIQYGEALIERLVGALVFGLDEKSGKPHNASEAAAIEFAVKNRKVTDIIVSAHTSCGGLDACMHGCPPDMNHLHDYLAPLQPLRDEIFSQWHGDEARSKAFGEASVRQSLKNLRSYPFVRDAVRHGELRLHGWMIDTATKNITRMNPKTKIFEPMPHRLELESERSL